MTDSVLFPLSLILRWPNETTRGWLGTLLEHAKTDSNVLAIVAVGSTIRPNVPSEDLDLVVVCETRDRFQYKSPIEVDVRTFDRAAVEAEIRSGHPLLGWAVQFGRPIFDRTDTWKHILLTWRDRVPLPDPTLARQRADKVLKHLSAVREMGDDVAASELELSYVTLLARASLAERGVYPASRPELPGQLRALGECSLADQLQDSLVQRGRILSRRAV